jgi:hypothetical protein
MLDDRADYLADPPGPMAAVLWCMTTSGCCLTSAGSAMLAAAGRRRFRDPTLTGDT